MLLFELMLGVVVWVDAVCCAGARWSWTLTASGACCLPPSLRTMLSRQQTQRRPRSPSPTLGPCSMWWSKWELTRLLTYVAFCLLTCTLMKTNLPSYLFACTWICLLIRCYVILPVSVCLLTEHHTLFCLICILLLLPLFWIVSLFSVEFGRQWTRRQIFILCIYYK